jgi:hypothetical protein
MRLDPRHGRASAPVVLWHTSPVSTIASCTQAPVFTTACCMIEHLVKSDGSLCRVRHSLHSSLASSPAARVAHATMTKAACAPACRAGRQRGLPGGHMRRAAGAAAGGVYRRRAPAALALLLQRHGALHHRQPAAGRPEVGPGPRWLAGIWRGTDLCFESVGRADGHPATAPRWCPCTAAPSALH